MIGQFDITNDKFNKHPAALKIPSGGFSTGDALRGLSPRVFPFATSEFFEPSSLQVHIYLFFFGSQGRSFA